MGKDWKEATSSRLTQEEIEKLLTSDFGDKLKPVDNKKLEKQRQNQAKSYGKKHD